MNVLITGGAGFIGSRLALKLLGMGHVITVLDTLSEQIHGVDPEKNSPLYQSISNKVKFIRGSVCEQSAWEQALIGQDAIVHLAAETGTGQSMYEIKRYVDVNVGGTALMLDLLANSTHSIKKVIVASSRSIYGEGKYRSEKLGVVYPESRSDQDLRAGRFDPRCPETGDVLTLLPTDEDSKLHPSSVYGITKLNQEQMVMTVCASLGIAASALRYQNVYGPGQSLKNPYTGILSIFSTRIKNHNSINIFEDGKESRDFVYIDDVVDATILALVREQANGEIFGIGSGIATDVLTVAHTLARKYEISVPIEVSGSYRLGDIRHNFADLSKARKLLGFEPKVTFEEGVGRFVDWVNSQEVERDRYEESIEEMKKKGLYN